MKKLKLVLVLVGILFSASLSFAQQRLIKGLITDTQGNVVPGVFVQLKGTSTVTSSDANGNYSIMVDGTDDVIVFAMIGMETREVRAGKSSVLNVSLSMESVGLDEVIVVGYGTTKKSDLTGSVSSVKTKDMLEANSSPTFESMLQGRVPGMQVFTSADNPRGGATIRVRGRSSLNGSNSPLVVLDGVPLGDAGALNTLNPSIIESIEVMKDASSTAIYGSRGANGVIMITTKQGKEGTFGLFLDYKLTLGDFSKKLDYFRDSAEMMTIANESLVNAGYDPLYVGRFDPTTGVYRPSIEEVQSGAWPYFTKWEDYTMRTVSVTHQAGVGVEGSKKDSRYRANFTYYRGEGMIINDDYEKFLVDISYSNKLNKWLNLKSCLSLFSDNSQNIHPGGFERNPLYPAFNPDGTPYKENKTDYSNPIGIRDNLSNTSDSFNAKLSLQLDFIPIKELVISLRAVTEGSFSDNQSFSPKFWSYEGDKYGNVASRSRNSWNRMKYDAYMTYSDTFNQKHNFSAMIGGSLDADQFKGMWGVSKGFSSVLKSDAMQAGKIQEVGNSYSRISLASGFTRINYNYDKRYYVTFTDRADGSSKFGTNNKWGFFPSGALSWRLSNEEFMKNAKSIDNLKFRLSYGISGNQGIAAYQTNTIYGSNWATYQGKDILVYGPGTLVGREGLGGRYITWGGIGNKNLKWERTSQLDFGIDLNMFENRFDVVLDIYSKTTSDLLRQQFLAPNTGTDKMWTNDGIITNKGVDLALDGDIIRTNKNVFSAGLVFSLNRNKVVSLGNELSSGLMTDVHGLKYEPFLDSGRFQESYISILALGKPVGVFYGYETDGIIQDLPDTDHVELQPGEINYKAMNPDGTMDVNQRKIIGDPNPDFTGSFNLSYKHGCGFDASVQFYGVYGNDVLSIAKETRTDLKRYRWTMNNPSNTYPRVREARRVYFSDWYLEDGSYLRLQNITLGYTLPKFKWISNARVYFNAANVFTLTKSTLHDPEAGENGTNQSYYPKIANYTFGVQVKF